MSEHRGERFALYRYWAEAISEGGGSHTDEEVLDFATRIVEIAQAHILKRERDATLSVVHKLKRLDKHEKKKAKR